MKASGVTGARATRWGNAPYQAERHAGRLSEHVGVRAEAKANELQLSVVYAVDQRIDHNQIQVVVDSHLKGKMK